MGKDAKVLADSGFRSESALRRLEKKGVKGYVALGREQKESPDISAAYPATARMARRLATADSFTSAILCPSRNTSNDRGTCVTNS